MNALKLALPLLLLAGCMESQRAELMKASREVAAVERRVRVAKLLGIPGPVGELRKAADDLLDATVRYVNACKKAGGSDCWDEARKVELEALNPERPFFRWNT